MFVHIHLSCTPSRLLLQTQTTVQTQTQILTNPRWLPIFLRKDFRLSTQATVRITVTVKSIQGCRYNHNNNSNILRTFCLMELADTPFHCLLNKATLQRSGCRDYLLLRPWTPTWGRSIIILRCDPRKLLHVPSRCGNGLNSSNGNRRLYQTWITLVIGHWIWLVVLFWRWLEMTLIFS